MREQMINQTLRRSSRLSCLCDIVVVEDVAPSTSMRRTVAESRSQNKIVHLRRMSGGGSIASAVAHCGDCAFAATYLMVARTSLTLDDRAESDLNKKQLPEVFRNKSFICSVGGV